MERSYCRSGERMSLFSVRVCILFHCLLRFLRCSCRETIICSFDSMYTIIHAISLLCHFLIPVLFFFRVAVSFIPPLALILTSHSHYRQYYAHLAFVVYVDKLVRSNRYNDQKRTVQRLLIPCWDG